LAVKRETETLPGRVNDVLGQVLVLLFFAVMAITPLVILVLGIVNLSRDKLHQGVIILQAVAALVVWTILSIAVVTIFIMITFEPLTYKSQPSGALNNAVFVGGILIYFLVSAVLIFWTRRMTKRMPGMGVSC
jgi:surface polysaccharide O-acyltransferase-like enzyme